MKDERKELSNLLSRLPDATVASNFTERVMQAVEREESRGLRPRNFNWIWRVFLPRAAVASAAVVLVGIAIHQREIQNQRAALAKKVALAVSSQPLPSVEALKNFDAIQRMSQPQPADEELLALLK